MDGDEDWRDRETVSNKHGIDCREGEGDKVGKARPRAQSLPGVRTEEEYSRKNDLCIKGLARGRQAPRHHSLNLRRHHYIRTRSRIHKVVRDTVIILISMSLNPPADFYFNDPYFVS